jgi:TolB-like protein/DNA-binding SARP family transcriptional activator
VTDPVKAQPIARYRLATFGPPALIGADADTFLGTHGHHRRRLALLAVLAAAGERGRSRDQLLLLFWPEATQTRARHSLDQLLYALRSSIGESVFDGVNPVRLNPELVTSDVGDFSAALERGDLEAAALAYSGPFLDGFYLTDAAEFERWAEAERTRLAAAYSGVMDRLAQNASAVHDHASAVRLRRTLVDVDPMSDKNASGLIAALMAAGDHTAALQHAKRYETLLQQELGVGAGPGVAALIDELRAKTQTRAETATALPPPLPEAEPEPEQGDLPAHPVARRRMSRVIGALVAAMAVVGVVTGVVVSRRPTARNSATSGTEERSIAVLPFTNVSGNPQDAPLVNGLSEELIAVLAKLGHVRVSASTSAFAFKNSDLGARQIADSLGVANILEGAAQKIGSHLRVQVRLIDARDGSTRWSEKYDRELRDIFAVQSEIAAAVARALDLELGATTLDGIKRGSTKNIAAYELYLRGNDPALTRSDSAARAGLEYFRQAIALDSGFAAAYAGLSRIQMRLAGNDLTPLRQEQFALAERAAYTAVALDDSLGDAHAALSMVDRSKYELAAADTEMMRAVALDPTNARFHEWLVQVYATTGQREQALAEGRRAQTLDPLSPTANAEFAHALIANDRCDEALAQLDKLKLLRPPLLRAVDFATQCYVRKKMWPEAVAGAQQLAATAGMQAQGTLGYVLAQAGRAGEARKVLDSLLERGRQANGDAFQIATVYAGLGDNDRAFAWLDRSLEDRSFAFNNQMIFDALAGDPRLDRFRERLSGQKR